MDKNLMEPLHKNVFFKLFFAVNFHSTIDPLYLKFFLATLDYLKKEFQNFYDFPYFLNLILGCYLSQKSFLKVKLWLSLSAFSV